MAVNQFYQGNQRFDANPVSLDDLAQAHGFASFNDMQNQSPQLASQLASSVGGGGDGTAYNSAAPSDDLSVGRLLAMLAATEVGGGFLQGGGVGGALAPAASEAAGAAPEAAGAATGVAGVTGGVGATGAQLAMTPEELAATASTGGVATAAGGSGTMGIISQILNAAGRGVGAASSASANNLSEEDRDALALAQLQLNANQQGQNAYTENASVAQNAYDENAAVPTQVFNANTTADSALQNELINRGTLEDTQRKQDLQNIFKQSSALNPSRSPYDPKGAPALSQDYVTALSHLADQGGDELAQAPAYSARNMPTLKPRTLATPAPFVPAAPYQAPAFTPPRLRTPDDTTLGNIGNWLGPILTGASALAR